MIERYSFDYKEVAKWLKACERLDLQYTLQHEWVEQSVVLGAPPVISRWHLTITPDPEEPTGTEAGSGEDKEHEAD